LIVESAIKIKLRFFLINERTGKQTEIDEPVKFDGFKPVFRRDKKTHGVCFEFAEQELQYPAGTV
jgi:hypothetical protein